MNRKNNINTELKNSFTLYLVSSYMYKTFLATLFSFLPLLVVAQREKDTFKIYFDLSVSALNTAAEKKIDLLIYNDKILTGSNVMIIGYADYLGTEKRNQNLSMMRAKSVKDYLVKYGINENDIKVCMGRGEIERTGMTDKQGFPTDRRVEIVVNNASKRKIADKAKSKYRKDTIIKRNIASLDEMKKLKPGSLFLLKNVYFPPDRHTISPESNVTLEHLYRVLKDNTKIKISIEGHVCCITSDAPDALDIDTYEPVLSVNRAKEIYNYLVSRGIDSTRLKYTGFGKRKPLVQYEQTEEDAEKNRRVEIRIIDN